jgi:hypothetical protein
LRTVTRGKERYSKEAGRDVVSILFNSWPPKGGIPNMDRPKGRPALALSFTQCPVPVCLLSQLWTLVPLRSLSGCGRNAPKRALFWSFDAEMEAVLVLVTLGDVVLYDISNQSHDFCPNAQFLR